MRRHDVRNPDHVADRLQLVGLVGHVAEDAVGDRVRAGIADQDDVAVRLARARLRQCRWCRRRRNGFPRPRTGPRRSADARPAMMTPIISGAAAGRGRHDERRLGGPPVGAVARARQDAAAETAAAPVKTSASRNSSNRHKLAPCKIVFAGSVGIARAQRASGRLGAGFPCGGTGNQS